MSPESDVIVVGAGVAGLAACVELERAGLRVTCVEARDRIGGRILTVRDPFAPLPIELGAEFVHGAPPEILHLAESAGLPLGQIGGDDKYFEKGAWVSSEGEGDDFGPLFDELERYPGPDQSWKDFADSSRATEQAKRAATAYVEGFNAARAEVIGVWSLREDMRAARSIDDRKQFRVSSGYDRIPLRLAGELRDSSRSIRLRSPVERIAWQKGRVAIYCRGVSAPLHARAAVITFPLGVLQECSSEHPPIQFVPNPEQILLAASRLVSGQVFRVVFRFAERFWEQADGLEDPGFLFSEEKTFPTWWTSAPLHAPMLTGWSAGPRAESLQGRSENEIAAEALATLARILPFPADFVADQVRAWYFHDWHADPYARGAYSYTPAGSLGARRELALPVQDTLFFAGEATETEGHSATVHGAIATGRRAAAQVAQTLESNPLR